MKTKKSLAIMVCALAVACALAFTGCGPKGMMGADFDDATGAYVITADNAGEGSELGTDGGIVVEKGQVLTIDSNMEKGSLQVKLSIGGEEGAESVLDAEASGIALETYELEPGEYGIWVSCDEDGTTGTVTVAAVDADKLD